MVVGWSFASTSEFDPDLRNIKLLSPFSNFTSVFGRVRVMAFNVTFKNISIILWRTVLLLEETGGPGEKHYYIYILT
jgi:hypothetical protein